MRGLILGLGLTLAACATPTQTGPLQLTATLTRADHQTYREIPFRVPTGVHRIDIEVDYPRDNRTVVDLGLRDPTGQRGWSGGNKSRITVGEFDATPSYRTGAIPPGVWTLVLGVPNIREGVSAQVTAKVTFDAPAPLVAAPLATGAGWRRGDFHTHTGHSDGSCDDGTDKRIPCPVVRTLEAARAAGLDFVAVTDHNTLSQLEALRELQPAFPKLLAIPGEEITTFWGHANAIGVMRPLDFQLGSPRLRDVGKLIDQVDAQGAVLSINHPAQPSGEACMGCGWTAETPWSRVEVMEAVNGGSVRAGKVEGSGSGIAFWEARLNQGLRITAIGGSDNHDALDAKGERQSPVGTPATVVWTNELSQTAMIAGLRSGRVFIDLENKPGRSADIDVRVGDRSGHMGDAFKLAPGDWADVVLKVEGAPGARIEPRTFNGLLRFPDGQDSNHYQLTYATEPQSAWMRFNVYSAEGKLIMISNPVYFSTR
jgi:hypothetical protein